MDCLKCQKKVEIGDTKVVVAIKSGAFPTEHGVFHKRCYDIRSGYIFPINLLVWTESMERTIEKGNEYVEYRREFHAKD